MAALPLHQQWEDQARALPTACAHLRTACVPHPPTQALAHRPGAPLSTCASPAAGVPSSVGALLGSRCNHRRSRSTSLLQSSTPLFVWLPLLPGSCHTRISALPAV